MEDELHRMQRPVLVIWGDRDTSFQPIADAQAQATLMPNSHFKVVRGGHEPWLDDVDTCAEICDNFPLPRPAP